jgi:hypothetical protein
MARSGSSASPAERLIRLSRGRLIRCCRSARGTRRFGRVRAYRAVGGAPGVRHLSARTESEESSVKNKAAHLAVGVDAEGRKEVLGIWVETTKGPSPGCGSSTSCAPAASRTSSSSSATG